jgi:hypothetical protein
LKANFETTRISLDRSVMVGSRVETGCLQAMGSTEFNLYSPTLTELRLALSHAALTVVLCVCCGISLEEEAMERVVALLLLLG